MRHSLLLLLTVCPGAVVAPGCSGGGAAVDAGGRDSSGDDASSVPDLATSTCAPVAPTCTDSQIQDLSLFKKASTRTVESAADGAGFSGHVDASGGGFTPTESFVYVKFTDRGVTRVDVGDEAAFASTDWDLGFRRYVIRLNSGVSGPSCVTGAEVADDYDALTAAPEGADYLAESYYDGACKMVPDRSGLMAPATVLQRFWKYTNCVQMTHQTYVIRLATGRRLKLTVTSYYAPSAQTTCDQSGSVPPGTAGGNVRFRFAWLDK